MSLAAVLFTNVFHTLGGLGMFKDIKFKTFKLEDLVGKRLHIRSFRDNNTEIIVAIDLDDGVLYVLKEVTLSNASRSDK